MTSSLRAIDFRISALQTMKIAEYSRPLIIHNVGLKIYPKQIANQISQQNNLQPQHQVQHLRDLYTPFRVDQVIWTSNPSVESTRQKAAIPRQVMKHLCLGLSFVSSIDIVGCVLVDYNNEIPIIMHTPLFQASVQILSFF